MGKVCLSCLDPLEREELLPRICHVVYVSAEGLLLSASLDFALSAREAHVFHEY